MLKEDSESQKISNGSHNLKTQQSHATKGIGVGLSFLVTFQLFYPKHILSLEIQCQVHLAICFFCVTHIFLSEATTKTVGLMQALRGNTAAVVQTTRSIGYLIRNIDTRKTILVGSQHKMFEAVIIMS